VTDGLRMAVARPSNYEDMSVERQTPVEDDTGHLHDRSHWKIHISDGYGRYRRVYDTQLICSADD